MQIIFYGVIAVGSMAIAIVVYTSVMLGWCCYCSRLPLPSTTIAAAAASRAEGEKSLSLRSPYIASSFRYKKGILENTEANSQPAGDECAVCLTAFSDGEIICQLPRCRHSFHSPCIDMWLFSHSDCPLCRASVDRVDSERRSNATEENSREVFLDIRSLS